MLQKNIFQKKYMRVKFILNTHSDTETHVSHHKPCDTQERTHPIPYDYPPIQRHDTPQQQRCTRDTTTHPRYKIRQPNLQTQK